MIVSRDEAWKEFPRGLNIGVLVEIEFDRIFLQS